MSNDNEENAMYKVLINHEDQYSLWPIGTPNPPGWREAEKEGTKEECLAYVEEYWTDMRPLSLQRSMQDAGIA